MFGVFDFSRSLRHGLPLLLALPGYVCFMCIIFAVWLQFDTFGKCQPLCRRAKNNESAHSAANHHESFIYYAYIVFRRTHNNNNNDAQKKLVMWPMMNDNQLPNFVSFHAY